MAKKEDNSEKPGQDGSTYMSSEVMRLIKVRANVEPAFREQLMKSPLKCLQEYDLTEDEKRALLTSWRWRSGSQYCTPEVADF